MFTKEFFVTLSVITVCVIQIYAQPPATYDLRTQGWVTPVKAQKSGTCWAHATASGLESDLLRTGNWKNAGETGDPNMAEYHLSLWMGFNKAWNGDFGAPNPQGQETHNWGDFKMFCAYMSRLDGPVRETDAPGDNTSAIPTESQIPLSKASYHRWYLQDLNWYYIDGDGSFGSLKYIDSIKYEVMRYGVCPTNYLCSGTATQTGTYNGLKTHYQPASSTEGPNHNIGIIGWDDNATTKYTQKGAWLCKNSWGAGSTPYLYISYWDKHCCRHIDESCVSFRNVVPLPYKKVYSHDYHGWRGSLKTAKECFNKFVAANATDQYLVDVSFFTLTVNEEWEIQVYDKYTGGTLQDELASVSGKTFAIGYHTARLNHPVTLKNGDDFYIYLKIKNGALAYDRTSSPFNPQGGEKFRADALVPSKAAADQSYYRTSETSPWTDLFNYEESITVNSQKVDCKGTHNFCIKGYAIDTMPVGIQSTPLMPCNNRFNLVNYPNPFASRTSIQYSVLENSSVRIEIFTVSGRMVYSFAVQKHTSAGTFKTAWEGRDQNGKPVSDGVYYAVLTVKTGRQIVSEKLKMCMAK